MLQQCRIVFGQYTSMSGGTVSTWVFVPSLQSDNPAVVATSQLRLKMGASTSRANAYMMKMFDDDFWEDVDVTAM